LALNGTAGIRRHGRGRSPTPTSLSAPLEPIRATRWIEARYQLRFLEIGTDEDHVHFLVQSVPTYSVSKVVTIIKSLTAREIFRRCPGVKKRLWGGEFWTDGYFASTVGRHGNEKVIAAYVKRQGSGYRKLHEQRQLALF
jgi:putative transposase